MKKIKSLLAALLLMLVLISCGDDDENEKIAESLSFKVNGELVTVTNPNAGFDILDRLVVTGSIGENQSITIGVLNTDKGTFTQDDISDSVSTLLSNYYLEYTDENDNFYDYSELRTSNFSITIDEFGESEGSLVSGSFSGLLRSLFFNGEAAPDSVVISEGQFTVTRSDATFENIY